MVPRSGQHYRRPRQRADSHARGSGANMNLAPAPEVVQFAARRAFPNDDARLRTLHKIIDEFSLLRGDFELSSGRRSNYLFQLRQATMHPIGGNLIGELVVEFMRHHNIRCVGGKELGAVPMVSAANVVGSRLQYPVSAFFVRKEAKRHGAKELVDGFIDEGSEILVVDDVTTTGGSITDAIDAAMLDKGRRIDKALSIIDRAEGAAEHLAKRGITLFSFFARRDFRIE